MGEEGLGLDGCECVWMRKPERVLFIETPERERGRKKREGGDWRGKRVFLLVLQR